ncbi:MAG TPA: M13 family metallopeptidase [Acidobacteriaceae bacterium]|nr:M13 family metallopeptidase [Acidobacteriaceae bacterium]
MRIRSAAPILGLLLATGTLLAQQAVPNASTAPTEPKALHSFDASAIDKSVDPCVDFYQYACGNWRKSNPIPADQVRWGTFNELAQRNQYLLYLDLKHAANDPSTPLQRKYGNFFAACMDTSLADKLGDQPILPLLRRVEAMRDRKQVAAVVAWLDADKGTDSFFRFGVNQDQKNSSREIEMLFQGGITLPDRSYYLEDNPRMQRIRQQYHDYIVTVMKLAGDSEAQADTEAGQVLEIETALAKGSLPRAELRDPAKRYHMLTVAALQALEPNFDWAAYFAGVKAPKVATLNVGQPDFFTAENQMLGSESLDALKAYLKFQVVNDAAPWLSTPFEDAHFDFFRKSLEGQQQPTPRWRRCTMASDRAMGEAVGQDWVKQHFPPSSKQSAEKLVAALKQALAADIQAAPWMTEATKQKAEQKLDEFRQKIGYPDNWRDYSTLHITRTDFIADLHNSAAFEFRYEQNKIGKPVNEKEWGMTPPTVNAYYDPPMNDINFPAGILQPPFYDAHADPAVNFGAIGVVIGHEMTHGFDDEGSKYDGHGNVKDWWTPADRAAFDQRTACLVNEYSQFQPVAGVHLNGKLTLGENTADNGGIHIAWAALRSTLAEEGRNVQEQIDGYTEAQRYFISYAQIWCQNVTPQYSRVAARVDPHSPGRFRVNGVVQNFPEFGRAFGCHKGQPMMPEQTCRVW